MKEEEIENIRSKVSKIMEMGDTQEENQTLKVILILHCFFENALKKLTPQN